MKHLRIALWVMVGVAALGFILMNLPARNGQGTSSVGMPVAGFNQGAHFTLTDHNGNEFNSDVAIAEGHYALIFFGFTHCPSICPTELQKFASVMDLLPKDTAEKITPLFITIDPERDTANALQEYVPMFHSSIKGLTGEIDKVHNILNDWKVYYAKVDDPQYSEYTMDHSTYSYLVDHDMNILAVYRLQTTAEQIADNIQHFVR